MNPITKKVILIVLCVVIALGGTLGIVFGTGIINTNQPSGGGGSTQPPITDGGGDSDNGNGDGDNGDNNQGGDGGEEGEQGDKKTIAINNFDYTYQSAGVDIVEYDGTQCKQFYLLSDGQEIPYNSGFVATAMVDKPYIIVYENFKTMGFVKFSCYIGFEKAARDNNSQAEVTFVVYVDNKAVFTSQPFTANTPQQLIEVDVRNADRITLVAMTEHTKNDAYVAWADCKLTYINNIKPNIQAYDVEMPSTYSVTRDNLLSIAKAYSWDGRDISNTLSYTTTYNGTTGNFSITYTAKDGDAVASKTVQLTVMSQNRYTAQLDDTTITQPFADYVYYGRSLLSEQSRKAYDYLMEQLLKVDISTSAETVTYNLVEQGIYLLPNEVTTVKKYMLYDDPRLYFLDFGNLNPTRGITYVLGENGLVETVTIKLNNQSTDQGYKGDDNKAIWKQIESNIQSYFAKLDSSMTDAQLLHNLVQSYHASKVEYDYSMSKKNRDTYIGAFINKLSICSGYTKGAHYLAMRVGIRSAYVEGWQATAQAGNYGLHAWNNVYLEGNWYWFDTTWGSVQGMLDFHGTYDHEERKNGTNLAVYPVLSTTDYDMTVAVYPPVDIASIHELTVGEQFVVDELVTLNQAFTGKVTIDSITYTGIVNIDAAGNYNITVTVKLSNGNKVVGNCEVQVKSQIVDLSTLVPTVSGEGNYTLRDVTLRYLDGLDLKEQTYQDAFYARAQSGTLTLSYDIAGKGFKQLQGVFGIDKEIWGSQFLVGQINCTVSIYADETPLYTWTAGGHIRQTITLTQDIPQTAQTLKLVITSANSTGGVGFADCKLYS